MLAGAERASRLLSLAAGLADTRTSDEVADVIFRETTAAVGADAATLALLVEPDHATSEPPEFVIVRSTGYEAALTERFRRFPLRAGRPLSDAVLSQQPVLIESAAAFRARYPEMARQTPELEFEAMANVPIMEHGRALAGITFSFATARRFDEATRTFLATIGEQCGLALGRARAFEAERRARESSSFLAEASGLLASSLDYEQTLRSLARTIVPRFADWCTIDMLVEPTLHAWPPRVERLAVAHQDPAKVAWAEEMATSHLGDWSATTGISRVLRDRVVEFYPHVDDEMLVAAAQTPEELALRREIAPSAVIIVPLVARGLVLGALTLAMSESGRRYDAADLALAEQIAERVAVAVDNARLFREAARARAVAEEANRAKMDFLATMSHELRTPLNAIAGYTQLLDLGVHGPVNEEQRTDLARIRDSGHHLLGLINDVLNYAKLEAGKVEITLDDVRLEPLVESVVSLVAPQADAKGLRLSVTELGGSATAAGGPGPVARADTEKVRQVLLNVLSNAIKYTARGGSITLAIEERGEVAMVCVRDTGIGIPADKLDRVFEPFVQLGRSLTSRDEGTGLGLAISRDLARAMGGDLVAESEEGVGSTFTLVLPRD
jgi:signal transduction histidine kinase